MKTTIPAANLAETEAGKNEARRRKAKLRVIDQTGNGNDAIGNLVRLSRAFLRGEPGKLISFIAAFRYRDKTGCEKVMNSTWGRCTLDEQYSMHRRLGNLLDKDDD